MYGVRDNCVIGLHIYVHMFPIRCTLASDVPMYLVSDLRFHVTYMMANYFFLYKKRTAVTSDLCAQGGYTRNYLSSDMDRQFLQKCRASEANYQQRCLHVHDVDRSRS